MEIGIGPVALIFISRINLPVKHAAARIAVMKGLFSKRKDDTENRNKRLNQSRNEETRGILTDCCFQWDCLAVRT